MAVFLDFLHFPCLISYSLLSYLVLSHTSSLSQWAAAVQKAMSLHHATLPIIHGFFCKHAFSSSLWLLLCQQSASTWPALQYAEFSYMGSVSLDLISSTLQRYKAFTWFHFTPGCDMVTALVQWDKNRDREINSLVMKWHLPVFFRCMRLGCSRFPPSCSGTQATSVCCFSPGLGSFLRPRSAASWAPRIGKRTETGTYFLHTLPRRNEPRERGNRCREEKRASPSKNICSVGGFKRLWRHGHGRSLLSIYNVARIIWPVTALTPKAAGGAVASSTRPQGILIKGRAVTRHKI